MEPRAQEAGESVDIGHAIRCLRGDRPQAQVASKARIDPTSWCLYEAGRRRPRESNLARIVRALGCSRVQFEEVVWTFRRRRLAVEELEPKAWRGARLSGFAEASGPQPPPPEPEQWQSRATALFSELLAILIPQVQPVAPPPRADPPLHTDAGWADERSRRALAARPVAPASSAFVPRKRP